MDRFFPIFNTSCVAKSLAKIDQLEVEVVLKRIVHIPPMCLTMNGYIAGFHSCSSIRVPRYGGNSSDTTPSNTISHPVSILRARSCGINPE